MVTSDHFRPGVAVAGIILVASLFALPTIINDAKGRHHK
jgi:hypothetical protein